MKNAFSQFLSPPIPLFSTQHAHRCRTGPAPHRDAQLFHSVLLDSPASVSRTKTSWVFHTLTSLSCTLTQHSCSIHKLGIVNVLYISRHKYASCSRQLFLLNLFMRQIQSSHLLSLCQTATMPGPSRAQSQNHELKLRFLKRVAET